MAGTKTTSCSAMFCKQIKIHLFESEFPKVAHIKKHKFPLFLLSRCTNNLLQHLICKVKKNIKIEIVVRYRIRFRRFSPKINEKRTCHRLFSLPWYEGIHEAHVGCQQQGPHQAQASYKACLSKPSSFYFKLKYWFVKLHNLGSDKKGLFG